MSIQVGIATLTPLCHICLDEGKRVEARYEVKFNLGVARNGPICADCAATVRHAVTDEPYTMQTLVPVTCTVDGFTINTSGTYEIRA